jgi:hypothetical protein
MAAAIGVILALVVGVFATLVRLDRDRAFYPTVTIVVASYYALFAVMGASTRVLVVEVLAGFAFLLAAALGFRRSLWIVAAALVAHGVFDSVRGAAIANPGVPAFWPAFCAGYDVAAGAYLAWLLGSRRVAATPGARGEPVS